MSAFNVVCVAGHCPFCKELGDFEVQFKYSNCWQIKYIVGDHLQWGGNDVGVKGLARVRVEGIAGPCRNCGTDYIECDVYLAFDQIVRVVFLADRKESFLEGYEVL